MNFRTWSAMSSSTRYFSTSYIESVRVIFFRMPSSLMSRIFARVLATISFVQAAGFSVSFRASFISLGERKMVSAVEEMARMLPEAS